MTWHDMTWSVILWRNVAWIGSCGPQFWSRFGGSKSWWLGVYISVLNLMRFCLRFLRFSYLSWHVRSAKSAIRITLLALFWFFVVVLFGWFVDWFLIDFGVENRAKIYQKSINKSSQQHNNKKSKKCQEVQ